MCAKLAMNRLLPLLNLRKTYGQNGNMSLKSEIAPITTFYSTSIKLLQKYQMAEIDSCRENCSEKVVEAQMNGHPDKHTPTAKNEYKNKPMFLMTSIYTWIIKARMLPLLAWIRHDAMLFLLASRIYRIYDSLLWIRWLAALYRVVVVVLVSRNIRRRSHYRLWCLVRGLTNVT